MEELAWKAYTESFLPETNLNWYIWKKAFELGYEAGKNTELKTGQK